jgi:hypothetical protein
VSSGVQAANSGRPELMAPLTEPVPAGPQP